MSHCLQRWLAGLSLTVAAAVAMAAGQAVLILRDDTAVSRQAADILRRELAGVDRSVNEAIVGEDAGLPRGSESNAAIVTFGARAFAAATRQAAGRPVVAAMITRAALEEHAPASGARWSAIVLDQPLERWLNLIETAFPARREVGLLVSPAGQKTARLLERKLAERRIALAIETISTPKQVVAALERLLPRARLILALPDNVVHNRYTVQPLLLTTYRAGVPVVAYSESYQRAGAVMALYSTVPQVVAQVVDTLRQFLDGQTPASIQSPGDFTVAINETVARSLGLALPAGPELTGRLRAPGQ